MFRGHDLGQCLAKPAAGARDENRHLRAQPGACIKDLIIG